MAGKYGGYPKYKTSGIQWLGEIPIHWEKKRIKETAHLINGYPFDSSKFEAGKGVPLVRIRDIRMSMTEVGFVGEVPPESRINAGDVLIGMDGDFNVALWSGGEAALNQRVACVRASNYHLQKFIFYVLPLNMKVVNDLTYFTTVKHLSSIDILKTAYALPPMLELNNIVSFLDHETAKIDTLIEKQQQLIKLLKEKRKAVISHAVTKGLNPSAPMCDSGVEWLGQVPEHWVVSALKYHVDTVNGFGFSSTDVCEEGVPFIRAGNIKKKSITETDLYLPQRVVDRYKRVILSEGDIVISMVGSDPRILDSAVGQVGVVPKSMAGAVPNQNVVILREKSDSILKRFLFYILCSEPYRNHLNVFSHKLANQSIISSSLIVNAKFMLPSTLEQKRIIDFLDKRLDNVDDVVLRNYDSLEFLTERRTALISAAVTGKIDVRSWQAPQPSNKSNNNYKEVAA